MAKYTRNTNKNKYMTKRQIMMQRRRRTTIVGIGIILLIFILILSSCISHSHKKKSAEEASSKAATKTTTEAPTETVTYERDIAFETDAAYAKNHKYCVGVNRKMNVVTVYEKDANNEYTVAVKAFPCSCGIGGDSETPLGTFQTSDKYEWLKMVDGSYAQYTLRITDQIWFHSVPYTAQDKGSLESEEYNKLGTAASLGCVRLRAGDAKWMYDNIDWRCIVFIYDSDTPSPLGVPEFKKMDLNSPNKGWDPTDPDKSNPWNKK